MSTRADKLKNNLWEDDLIQFARLLTEIVATQELDIKAISRAMSLCEDEVEVLLERAHLRSKKQNQ